MRTLPLIVSDETLRDGEQQPGLFFSFKTKQTLAHLAAQAGVHQIAIMPAIHEAEERLLKTLVAEGLGSITIASTMLGKKEFIDRSIACGVEQIILFYTVSDRLLLLRDPEARNLKAPADKNEILQRARQNMINKVLENLRYATSAEVGLKVEFAAEDASRADFNFLVECIRKFQPYVEHFILCDTMGILSPEKTYIWVRDLLELTDNAPLAVHFHNDFGMALENTIQAVLAGASMISRLWRHWRTCWQYPPRTSLKRTEVALWDRSRGDRLSSPHASNGLPRLYRSSCRLSLLESPPSSRSGIPSAAFYTTRELPYSSSRRPRNLVRQMQRC